MLGTTCQKPAWTLLAFQVPPAFRQDCLGFVTIQAVRFTEPACYFPQPLLAFFLLGELLPHIACHPDNALRQAVLHISPPVLLCSSMSSLQICCVTIFKTFIRKPAVCFTSNGKVVDDKMLSTSKLNSQSSK